METDTRETGKVQRIRTASPSESGNSKNPQSGSASTRSISDIRTRILARIILEYRLAMQFEPLETDELARRAAAFRTPTLAVPEDRLYDCYVFAMQNRKSDKSLNAIELVEAWRLIQDGYKPATEVNGRKLLVENAKTACERCFGSGFETVDGKGARPCKHKPLTDHERQDREKAREEFFQKLEEMRNAPAAPKIPVVNVEAELAPERFFKCSDCARKVSSREGWTRGEKCRRILTDSTICEGRFNEEVGK